MKTTLNVRIGVKALCAHEIAITGMTGDPLPVYFLRNISTHVRYIASRGLENGYHTGELIISWQQGSKRIESFELTKIEMI